MIAKAFTQIASIVQHVDRMRDVFAHGFQTQLAKVLRKESNFLFFFQTFYNCDDSSSNSIKEEYCGSSTKTLGDDFTFSLPVKFGKVGTRSIYCEYNFIVSDDDDIYYNI